MRFSPHSPHHSNPCTISLPHPTPQISSHILTLFCLPQWTPWASKCPSSQLPWGLLGDPSFPAQLPKSIAEDHRSYWQPESKESILINPPHENDGLQPSCRQKPTNLEWKENKMQAWLPMKSIQPDSELCSGSHRRGSKCGRDHWRGPWPWIWQLGCRS